MHGRVKVKSTEEQKEIKERERARKLEIYQSTARIVFEKRREGVFDEESLSLTGKILAANPDLMAFWNFRREILLDFAKKKPEGEVESLYSAELPFLASCLRINPKSYGTWFHRKWILMRQREPDWGGELSLCVSALDRDERNFHCWDYRRFVVESACLPLQAELEFSNRLIACNFSNYSSWHYRSQLLPRLYPDKGNTGRLSHTALLTEYSLVQNAFFTDPNDQSAWFYHRWLLGRAERQTRFMCLYVNFASNSLSVALSSPVNLLKKASKMIVVIDRKIVEGFWNPANNRNKTNCVWICCLPEGTLIPENSTQKVKVIWEQTESERECYRIGNNEGWSRETASESGLFRSDLSVEAASVLEGELESCKQLLELEPENKWCLLTLIWLMRSLDPLSYERESARYLQRVRETDAMRDSYYSDLGSRFLIEDGVLKMEYAETRALSLTHKTLTTLCHLEQMLLVTHLDLSANQLSTLGPSLSALRCLEMLSADDNKIESIEGVRFLPKLVEISLKNNRLREFESLEPLSKCANLTRVCLTGNTLCLLAGVSSHLLALLPQATDIVV